MTWSVVTGRWQDVELPERVDQVIVDPPYSRHVHSRVRRGASLPDVAELACRVRRSVDLGFEPIAAEEMVECARAWERMCSRWVLVFSDVESTSFWRGSFEEFEYVRTGAWIKLGCTPQFTGDRPAVGYEAITMMHPRGRKRWNGGGSAGVWAHAVVQNRYGHPWSRVHPAQKPIGLMLDLVRLFSDPGDTILDPYCGSGTTGVAAVRLGRHFVGVERDPAHADVARERLAAEESGSTLQASRAGQECLFGGES